jgi:preprotein translocase subunit YajC
MFNPKKLGILTVNSSRRQMMNQLEVGQRVLYGDFGEGTVVKIGNDPKQVVVAFSEVETLDLPASALSQITSDTQ